MADPTLEELQEQNKVLAAQLAEAGNSGGDDELRKQLKALTDERQELIDGRDKAKAKAREAEDAKLAEQGEFKTLAEQRQSEVDALTKQLEGLNGTITSYTERDKAELAKLLESVPEALRGTVSSEKIPLAEQLTLARQLATVKPDVPGARNAGKGSTSSINRAEFDSKSPTEKSDFIKGGGTVTD